MKNLNILELSILKTIVEDNKNLYPYLSNHFEDFTVKDRKYSGVGIIVNLGYRLEFQETKKFNILLSSTRSLFIEGLDYEVSYALCLNSDKGNFLEIISNGADWDGSYGSFKLM